MRHYNPRFVYFLPTFWSSFMYCDLWPYVWLNAKYCGLLRKQEQNTNAISKDEFSKLILTKDWKFEIIFFKFRMRLQNKLALFSKYWMWKARDVATKFVWGIHQRRFSATCWLLRGSPWLAPRSFTNLQFQNVTIFLTNYLNCLMKKTQQDSFWK